MIGRIEQVAFWISPPVTIYRSELSNICLTNNKSMTDGRTNRQADRTYYLLSVLAGD